ncbi:MAG TPA: glycine--tRNA ligase subunit beta [Terriglobia bacterium]|nr:glycine--tRNA ligase subunit beta [Terriglobia bacterium]
MSTTSLNPPSPRGRRPKQASAAYGNGDLGPKPGTTLPLLVEIGCEEIPARFLDEAQRNLAQSVRALLTGARLLPDLGPGTETVLSYSTPRRLVIYVPHTRKKQPDQVDEVAGPPVKVAFDADGNPTRAAESFAKKNGVAVESLIRVTTPKGQYLAVRRKIEGRPTYDVLRDSLAGVITGIAFPKSMYWTAKSGPRFIRPIRWVLAIHGEGRRARIVPFEIARVAAGCWTYRHRRAGSHRMRVRSFADYAEKLREGMVEFDPGRRREVVRTDLKALLQDTGLRVVKDEALEDWVVASTEWPHAMLGSFEERFLKLPREILVTVMRDHQKYFAVEDSAASLQPRFITVLNVEGDLRGVIRAGHERVLTARFTDAEFFWKADQRVPLRDRLPLLEKVTYHDKLGSYADKVRRMKAVAQEICDRLDVTSADREHVLRAVELSKCDLTTQMVQEFTELQGVVGGLYAREQGEPEEVAKAIYDQYRPQGIDDAPPGSRMGAIVSISDKLDSVAGGFGAGLDFTGSSDPFGFRRLGNGIVRTVLEWGFRIPLGEIVDSVFTLGSAERAAVRGFLRERLRYHLESARGLPYDVGRAVVDAPGEVNGPIDLVDLLHRATAVQSIRASEDFEALCAAAKRIRNILTKSATTSDWSPGDLDRARLEPGLEIELYEAYRSVAEEADRLATAGQYEEALRTISTLRPAVDRFFDEVLVMAEDKTVRQNRLRLLDRLNQLFSGITDLSQIESSTLSRVDAPTSRAAAGKP